MHPKQTQNNVSGFPVWARSASQRGNVLDALRARLAQYGRPTTNELLSAYLEAANWNMNVAFDLWRTEQAMNGQPVQTAPGVAPPTQEVQQRRQDVAALPHSDIIENNRREAARQFLANVNTGLNPGERIQLSISAVLFLLSSLDVRISNRFLKSYIHRGKLRENRFERNDNYFWPEIEGNSGNGNGQSGGTPPSSHSSRSSSSDDSDTTPKKPRVRYDWTKQVDIDRLNEFHRENDYHIKGTKKRTRAWPWTEEERKELVKLHEREWPSVIQQYPDPKDPKRKIVFSQELGERWAGVFNGPAFKGKESNGLTRTTDRQPPAINTQRGRMQELVDRFGVTRDDKWFADKEKKAAAKQKKKEKEAANRAKKEAKRKAKELQAAAARKKAAGKRTRRYSQDPYEYDSDEFKKPEFKKKKPDGGSGGAGP